MSEICKSRKVGGSVIVPLTGFVEPDRFFEIEKKGNQIILTEQEIKPKEE